jgi:hypothetical protein
MPDMKGLPLPLMLGVGLFLAFALLFTFPTFPYPAMLIFFGKPSADEGGAAMMPRPALLHIGNPDGCPSMTVHATRE